MGLKGGGLQRKSKTSEEIPSSSMADIAFLLLIFFMVSTVFQKDRNRPIEWAQAEATEKIDQKQKNILNVWVESNGDVYINDVQRPMDEVSALIGPMFPRQPRTPRVDPLGSERAVPLHRRRAAGARGRRTSPGRLCDRTRTDHDKGETMTDPTTPDAAAEPQSMLTENANDRFKSSFSSWFWGSMIAATAAHFVLFNFVNLGEVDDVSLNMDEIATIDIPPEIEIPPPPEAIARPATPVVSAATIDEDITIAPVTFESNPVEDLPPPPEDVETDISAAPVFIPYTVKPDYTNASEVMRALEREYPPLLRDAGIGGTTVVWFFIDEQGTVRNQTVNQTSGHQALDDAALRVAPVFKFTPALNRDKAVAVWIQLPITFTTR